MKVGKIHKYKNRNGTTTWWFHHWTEDGQRHKIERRVKNHLAALRREMLPPEVLKKPIASEILAPCGLIMTPAKERRCSIGAHCQHYLTCLKLTQRWPGWTTILKGGE